MVIEKSSKAEGKFKNGDPLINNNYAAQDAMKDHKNLPFRHPLKLPLIKDTIRLDEKNYAEWHRLVCIKLQMKGLSEHLTNGGPKVDDPGFMIWGQDDSMIKMWLLDSMIPRIRDRFRFLGTVKDIWDAIHRYYLVDRRLVLLYEAKVKFRAVKQGNRSVQEYIDEFMYLCFKVDFYRGTTKGWPEDKVARQRLRDEDIALDFLIGLRPEFDRVICLILDTKKFIRVEELYHIILFEESRLLGLV